MTTEEKKSVLYKSFWVKSYKPIDTAQVNTSFSVTISDWKLN